MRGTESSWNIIVDVVTYVQTMRLPDRQTDKHLQTDGWTQKCSNRKLLLYIDTKSQHGSSQHTRSILLMTHFCSQVCHQSDDIRTAILSKGTRNDFQSIADSRVRPFRNTLRDRDRKREEWEK